MSNHENPCKFGDNKVSSNGSDVLDLPFNRNALGLDGGASLVKERGLLSKSFDLSCTIGFLVQSNYMLVKNNTALVNGFSKCYHRNHIQVQAHLKRL